MIERDNGNIAVLRVELHEIEPLIWRRIGVRTSITLPGLHAVIQAAMGWLDYHLWAFRVGHRRYSLSLADHPEWNERITDAARGLAQVEWAAGLYFSVSPITPID